MPVDIAFDTSAASRWEAESQLLERTSERIIARGDRLIIPLVALIEMAASSNVKRNQGRWAAIRELLTTLGPERAAVGMNVEQVLRRERWQTQYRVPVALTESLTLAFDAIAAGDSPPEFSAFLDKEARFDHDRGARQELAEPGVVPDAADADRLVPGLLANVLEPGAFGLEEIIDDARWLARVRAHPQNYPAAVLFAGLMNLQATAATFPHEARGGWTGLLRNVRPQDWVDMWISVSCAHADVFVTNDEQQANRIAFVAQHLPVRVRPTSLGDWLAEA